MSASRTQTHRHMDAYIGGTYNIAKRTRFADHDLSIYFSNSTDGRYASNGDDNRDGDEYNGLRGRSLLACFTNLA